MRHCILIAVLVLAVAWLAGLGAGAAGPPAPPPAARIVQGPPVGFPAPATPIPPPAPAPATPIPPPAPAARPTVQPSDRVWQVNGYGETKNDAQQRALENARESVELFLREKFPDLHWTPKAGELRDLGVVRVDEPTAGTFGELKGYESVANVDVSDPNLRKMQGKVDEERRKELEPIVSQRHLLLCRILGSLVALFLVAFGYIKLEELTRGYYTTLLRLGAGAMVLAAVLGLFLGF